MQQNFHRTKVLCHLTLLLDVARENNLQIICPEMLFQINASALRGAYVIKCVREVCQAFCVTS